MLRPAAEIEGERRKALASFVARMAAARPGEPIHILEVGSLFGESAIIWAKAIEEYAGGRGVVTCVDPWAPLDAAKEQLLPAELAPQFASGEAYLKFRAAIAEAGVEHLVDERRGTSEEILPVLANGSYDIVYLDGDHSYAQTQMDIALASPLVREGGLLAGDDLELLFEETMQTLTLKWVELGTDYVHDPRAGLWFHPGVSLAVYRAFRRVSRFGKTWAVVRRGAEWSPL